MKHAPHLSGMRLPENILGALLLASMLLVSACAPEVPVTSISDIKRSTPEPAEPAAPVLPSVFETDGVSAFLAARQAIYENDISAASRFYQRTVTTDSDTPLLLKRSFMAHYQNGDLEDASYVARLMERRNIDFAIAAEPAIADAIISDDWPAIIALSEKIASHQANLALAALLRAYAYFGMGEPELSLRELQFFNQIVADTGQKDSTVYQLQHAYFAELQNRSNEAVAIYNYLAETARLDNSYLILQIASGLWRYGETDTAIMLVTDKLPASFNTAQIIRHLENSSANTPEIKQLMAASFLELSWFSEHAVNAGFLLPRAQLAQSIWPDFDAASFVIALNFHNLEQSEKVDNFLALISEDSPWYQRRVVLELEIFQRGQDYAGGLAHIRAYQKFVANHPQQQFDRDTEHAFFERWAGNFLRYQKKYATAIGAYKTALDYVQDDWVTWRSLAICYERTSQTEKAEEAFQKGLSLNPNDAVALNYLGYWWADEGRRLDEAIELIKKAVSLYPRSGAYADSLGWVYYKQEEYDEAVGWLETAIQLDPTDGIIADHLGDAYWQTGRTDEAYFKWQLALELGLEAEAEAVTRHKLQNGL